MSYMIVNGKLVKEQKGNSRKVFRKLREHRTIVGNHTFYSQNILVSNTAKSAKQMFDSNNVVNFRNVDTQSNQLVSGKIVIEDTE